jgi:hypothetical protein
VAIVASGKTSVPHPCDDSILGTHAVCPFSQLCDVETSGAGSCLHRGTDWLTEQTPVQSHMSHWHMCKRHADAAKRLTKPIMNHLFTDYD